MLSDSDNQVCWPHSQGVVYTPGLFSVLMWRNSSSAQVSPLAGRAVELTDSYNSLGLRQCVLPALKTTIVISYEEKTLLS